MKSSVLTIWHQLKPAELNGNKIPKERIKVYQFVVTLLIYTYTYIQEIATGKRIFYMLIFFTKGFLSIYLPASLNYFDTMYLGILNIRLVLL